MVSTSRILTPLTLLLCSLWLPLFCPASWAGPISLDGYDAGVDLTGYDYSYPSGAATTLISTSTGAPANSPTVNLSLTGTGTDGIVSVSGQATLTATEAIAPGGYHATADITESGATTTTGAYEYQAQVLAQSTAYFTFTVTAPTRFHYDYSGSANLILRDPSGFDGYTYTALGSVQGFLPTQVEWSPTTFSTSGTLLLGPGTYTVSDYQQSFDTQNPNSPGTYSESTFSKLHIDLQATPEPASLTLLGIGAAGLLGFRWRRRTALAAPCS